MNDVECPYCSAGQEINHDDGYGYEEDETYEQECPECGKIFVYTTSIIFSYDAHKADCKNEGEHIWEPTITYPRELTKMRCNLCDEKREMTPDEKKKYKISNIDIP